MCREDIVNEAGAYAGNFICSDGCAHPAAAERHRAFNAARGDRPSQRNDEVGVVIIESQLVGAVVLDLVPGGAQRRGQFGFQRKAAVICGDSHPQHLGHRRMFNATRLDRQRPDDRIEILGFQAGTTDERAADFRHRQELVRIRRVNGSAI